MRNTAAPPPKTPECRQGVHGWCRPGPVSTSYGDLVFTVQCGCACHGGKALPIVAQTDRQRRGRDCAVCGVVLSPATARDLGPRPMGGLVRFPRVCRRHEEASDS